MQTFNIEANGVVHAFTDYGTAEMMLEVFRDLGIAARWV